MILRAATDGWHDVGKLLNSLPALAKHKIMVEAISWAMNTAVDENLEENPINNEVFEELARIGVVLVLRRAGLLNDPVTAPPPPCDIKPEDLSNLFGFA